MSNKQFQVEPIIYSAVGWDRPMSGAQNAGLKALEAATSRFPRAREVIEGVRSFMGRAWKGSADFVTVEYDPDLLNQGKGVFHIKFKLAEITRMPNVEYEAMVKEMSNTLPISKENMADLKKIFDAQRSPEAKALLKKGIVNGSDVRLTIDNDFSGFRVGVTHMTVLGSDKAAPMLLLCSARLGFDANGQLKKGQLLVSFEKNTQSSDSGVWAGLGAGVAVSWYGDLNQSPIRRDKAGNPGLELEVEKQRYFVAIPKIKKIIDDEKAAGHKLGEIPLSTAPTMSAQDYAARQLKISDPETLKQLNQTVKVVEQGGALFGTASDLIGRWAGTYTGGEALAALSARFGVVFAPGVLGTVAGLTIIPSDSRQPSPEELAALRNYNITDPKSNSTLHIYRYTGKFSDMGVEVYGKNIKDPNPLDFFNQQIPFKKTFPSTTTDADIIKMMQTPGSPLYGLGVPSHGLGTPSAAEAGFIKQGWVGCESTRKQLIYGTMGKDGSVQVRNDAGTVLATYAQGTTKQQIADTMANPNSVLYLQGSPLVHQRSAQGNIDAPSTQGKYKNGDTIGDLPGGHHITYFETLLGEGPPAGARNVKTSTSTYKVPDSVGPGKDDVRAWVIRSIEKGDIKFPEPKTNPLLSTSNQGYYKNGDTIGDLPGGHHVTYFETLPGEGPPGGARNVKTSTSTYKVPDSVGPGKDDVRAWVIRSIEKGDIKFPEPVKRTASSNIYNTEGVASTSNSRFYVTEDPNTHIVAIYSRGDNNLITNLKPGATRSDANKLIEMGAFNSEGKQPVAVNPENPALAQQPSQKMRMA